VLSAPGVLLYQKVYQKERDFVQVVDLDQGATISFTTGRRRSGKGGVYGRQPKVQTLVDPVFLANSQLDPMPSYRNGRSYLPEDPPASLSPSKLMDRWSATGRI
jgi:hypothetical protein